MSTAEETETSEAIEYPDVKLPKVCPKHPEIVAKTKEEIQELFGWRRVSSDPDRYAPQSWSRKARSAAAKERNKAKKKEEPKEKPQEEVPKEET